MNYLRLHEISSMLEREFNADCVIIQNGAFYEGFGSSALYLSENFDYKLYYDQTCLSNGQNILKAGFPLNAGLGHLRTRSSCIIILDQTDIIGNRGVLVREIIETINLEAKIIGWKFNEKKRSNPKDPSNLEFTPVQVGIDRPVNDPTDYLDTYETTAYYFRQGMPVKEIAKLRGINAITIGKHFYVLGQKYTLTIGDVFLDNNQYLETRDLILSHPNMMLKELFEVRSDKLIQYFQIYYVLGILAIPLKKKQ